MVDSDVVFGKDVKIFDEKMVNIFGYESWGKKLCGTLC